MWRWLRIYITFPFLLMVGLLMYVLFFNEHNYARFKQLNAEIANLKEQIKAVNDTLEYYRHQNELLESSPDEIERIVREKYLMQNDNEEVFIFE